MYIWSTKDRVCPHFETLRRELKIRREAVYFWRTLRCLEIWSNCLKRWDGKHHWQVRHFADTKRDRGWRSVLSYSSFFAVKYSLSGDRHFSTKVKKRLTEWSYVVIIVNLFLKMLRRWRSLNYNYDCTLTKYCICLLWKIIKAFFCPSCTYSAITHFCRLSSSLLRSRCKGRLSRELKKPRRRLQGQCRLKKWTSILPTNLAIP